MKKIMMISILFFATISIFSQASTITVSGTGNGPSTDVAKFKCRTEIQDTYLAACKDGGNRGGTFDGEVNYQCGYEPSQRSTVCDCSRRIRCFR